MKLLLDVEDLESKLAQVFEMEGLKIVGEITWQYDEGEDGKPKQPNALFKVEPCVPSVIVSEVSDIRIDLSEMFEQLTKSLTGVHKKLGGGAVTNGVGKSATNGVEEKEEKSWEKMNDFERAAAKREERLTQVKKDLEGEAEEFRKTKRPGSLILPKNR